MSDDIKQSVAPTAPEQAAEPKIGTDPNEAFAKKEKQLRRLQQQLEQEKRSMQAKLQDYETNYMPKSRLKEDPISVLMEQGYTHEQIMERMLNATPNNDPTIKALESKLKALEDRLAGTQKADEERTTQQYQQAVKQIDREVKLLVDSDPEFESIKSAGIHNAVTELIEQTFNEEGVLLDVREAARQVENHLVEQALKMSSLSKVKARLQSTQAETEAKNGTGQKQAQPTGAKTLTNQMQASSGKLSEKEKRERAIAAFYGKGN